MDSREVIKCRILGKERYCVKGKKRYYAQSDRMTKEEKQIAAAAKQGALEILRDALKKKDKVLTYYPDEVVLEGEARGAFWMKRHAVLTERKVQKLLAELEKVTFKKDVTEPDTFAYVDQNDLQRTVYLCTLFWKCPQYLAEDSQPGILIHEVSHFLGTDDFCYEQNTIEVCCNGLGVNGIPCLNKNNWDVLRNALLNANNIEYEFELTIRHRGEYEKGKYSCCGETARYSVCAKSVPEYFFTGKIDRKWKTENFEKLLKKSQTISPKMRRITQIVAEIEKSLSTAKTDVSTSVLRGAAAVWSTELYAIFTECRCFLDDFQSLIRFLNHGFGFFREYTQAAEFQVHQVNMFMDEIKEKTRSRGGDEQKMPALINQFHSYMKDVLENTERLCQIFI